MSAATESVPELVLTIAEFSPAPAGGRTRRLRGGRLVVGRAAPSDWVLDDPDRMLSKQHCRFEWRGGAYHVVDSSTNGVFLNGAEAPLGSGNSAKLGSGDLLALGAYSLRVSISGGMVPPPAGALASAEPLLPDDDWLPSRDGAAVPLPEPEAALPSSGWMGSTDGNHAPQDDFFRPPAVEDTGIPDDWYQETTDTAECLATAPVSPPLTGTVRLPGAAAAEAAADELRAHVLALHQAVAAVLGRLPAEQAAEAARVLHETYAAARFG